MHGWHSNWFLLLRTLDGDARHSNKSCCTPQILRVTKELVPQRGVLWPCFSPDNIMEWAVLGQLLAGVGSLGAAVGWSGQSWSRCWLEWAVLEQVLAGVGSLGAGAGLSGQSWSRCWLEWAVLEQVLAGVGSLGTGTGWSGQSWSRCWLEWAVLEQVLAGVGSLGAGAGWSGQSWGRYWLLIGAVSQGQRPVWPVLRLLR